MNVKISKLQPPVAPSGSVTVHIKAHGNKYMATYTFASRDIRKIISAHQLTELRADPAYIVHI